MRIPGADQAIGHLIKWSEKDEWAPYRRQGTASEPCRSFGASQQSHRYAPSFSLPRGEPVTNRMVFVAVLCCIAGDLLECAIGKRASIILR
jgi:hypothetical protein